ncbi:MAG TPA: pyridoxamine 5'-phosphate oxidase family protein [Pyrinomonadaceae bacterium]|nr:pyridoxamine 5'-phosphate oxidase family protein [Pyrinomonadaceae bacterium]
MFIHEMRECECWAALEQATFGRLACSHADQPYIVPIYFAVQGRHLYGGFDGSYLYGFTTLGKKIEWMRSNPQVCVEIDERERHDQWMSVIGFGLYEELPDLPEFEEPRRQAHNLLKHRAMWWEPAYISSSHRDSPHSFTPIFYRIRLTEITGHRATPDQNQVPPVSETRTVSQ